MLRRVVAFIVGAAAAAILAPQLHAQRLDAQRLDAPRAPQLGSSIASTSASAMALGPDVAATSGVGDSVQHAAAQAAHQATQEAAQQIALSHVLVLHVPAAPVTPPAPPAPLAQQQKAAQPGTPPAPASTPATAAATAASVKPPTAATAATTAATGTSAPASGASNAATTTDAMLTKLAPQMDLRMGGKGDQGLHLSGTVGIVVMMGLLTLLPTLLLLMTGFTRILIVLHFLRQALGTQNAPPAALVSALALILTGFVMAPTLTKVNETALKPWMDGKIEQTEMMQTAVVPFREFMLAHTRDHDLQVFIDMSQGPQPKTEADIPLVTVMSAFATSELRTAFQIGFAIFLPFIIIDIVVSSVLMSMGMFMLPPAMISLPFKLLLFVLVDGWTLVVQSLVTSFRV